jgi:hypothetical protein
MAMVAAWWRTTVAFEVSGTTFRIDPMISVGLFCAALDDLGIPRTRPSRHHVAIYRKAAVGRQDEFIGPKA